MLYSTNIGEKDAQVVDPKAAAKALRAMKAREARLKKKAEQLQSVPEEVKEEEVKVEEVKVKKPRAKKVPATPPPTESETSEIAPVKKPRAPRTPKEPKPQVDENVMPAWFKTYVTETRIKEAKVSEPEVSERTIKKRAAADAQEKWQDEGVRQKVQKVQDTQHSAYDKLYSQMFRR